MSADYSPAQILFLHSRLAFIEAELREALGAPVAVVAALYAIRAKDVPGKIESLRAEASRLRLILDPVVIRPSEVV